MASPQKNYIPTKERFAYGCGDAASALVLQSVTSFMMIFYTDVFGITAAAFSTMVLISKIWDAINDPIVGTIADRTQRKEGKFRPYFKWFAIPFGISLMLAFFTPDLVSPWKLVYAWLTYNALMMIYSLINVPYSALLGVISPNPTERTTLASYKFSGYSIARIIVETGTLYFVAWIGGSGHLANLQLRLSHSDNSSIVVQVDRDAKRLDILAVPVEKSAPGVVSMKLPAGQHLNIQPADNHLKLTGIEDKTHTAIILKLANEAANQTRPNLSTGWNHEIASLPVWKEKKQPKKEKTGLQKYQIASLQGTPFFNLSKASRAANGDLVYTLDIKNSSYVRDQRVGFGWTMAIFGIAAMILWSIVYRGTNERVNPPLPKPGALKHDLGDLLHNWPWIALSILGLVTAICWMTRGSITVHYFKYYVGDESLASWFLGSGDVAWLIGVMVTKWLVQLFGGKRTAYAVLLAVSGAANLVYFWIPPQDIGLIFGLNILNGFVSGPIAPIIWSMFTDIADFSEWKNGRRATGLVISAAIFSQKMGFAVGTYIAAGLLAFFGYHPNVAQTTETLHAILYGMAVIPGIGLLISAGLIYIYPLTENKMHEITADLATRKGAAADGAA